MQQSPDCVHYSTVGAAAIFEKKQNNKNPLENLSEFFFQPPAKLDDRQQQNHHGKW